MHFILTFCIWHFHSICLGFALNTFRCAYLHSNFGLEYLNDGQSFCFNLWLMCCCCWWLHCKLKIFCKCKWKRWRPFKHSRHGAHLKPFAMCLYCACDVHTTTAQLNSYTHHFNRYTHVYKRRNVSTTPVQCIQNWHKCEGTKIHLNCVRFVYR